MRRILVVDDELTITEVVELALSMNGFEVTVARDGREALARLLEHRPDLVLSDVMMPYIDGVELARRIHEMPSLRSVPVVLMSASGRPPKNAGHAYAAFLAKPFDLDTLLATIDRVLGPAPAAANGDRPRDQS